jgi:hypothetical protein
MDQNSVGFMYLKNTFPRISDAKIKEGVFVGPHMGELKQDVKFAADSLSELEKSAWKSFKKSLPFIYLFIFEIIRQKTIVM